MPILGSSASPKGVPTAPTIGTATAGDGSASVTFTAPGFSKLPVTSYTVTASPGGATGTGSSSPITVSGLTNGTAYTFTVRATAGNSVSAASAASNSASPVGPYALSQTFNASGTYTVPAGKTKLAAFVVSGGGGGGTGAARTNGDGGAGGAGGGGGYIAAFKDYSVSAGQSFSVTVGSAGNASASINPANQGSGTTAFGGSGGASAFSSLLSVNGGTGGYGVIYSNEGSNGGAAGNLGGNSVTVQAQGSGGTGGASGRGGLYANTTRPAASGAAGTSGGFAISMSLTGLGTVNSGLNGSGGGGGGGGEQTEVSARAGGSGSSYGGNGGNGGVGAESPAANIGNAALQPGGGGGGGGGIGRNASDITVTKRGGAGAAGRVLIYVS